MAGGDPRLRLMILRALEVSGARHIFSSVRLHQRITTAHSPTRSVADGWLTSPTYSLSRVTFAPLAHSRQRNQQRFLLAPDTYAVRVTGDFKAASVLTTARKSDPHSGLSPGTG